MMNIYVKSFDGTLYRLPDLSSQSILTLLYLSTTFEPDSFNAFDLSKIAGWVAV